MLFLPLEEDSLLFRLCLYYGALVLLLELLVPLLFQRRIRIEIPRLPLRAPVAPLSTREFQQRRLALRQQVAALQRDLAETPCRSPQKRRQVASAKAAKQRPAASSPLASSTSLMKKGKSKSARKTREIKRKKREQEHQEGRPAEQISMAMSDFLATSVPRRGGFSFDEIREEGVAEENKEEREDWTQAVNTRLMRRRESPKFSGRRPVRLVDEVESVGYSGPSEAATRLEALIGARRRRRETSQPSYMPPPPPLTAKNHSPAPELASVIPAAGLEKLLEPSVSQSPKPARHEDSLLIEQQNGQKTRDEGDETEESESSELLTDFQAFCASFASGGSAAAQAAAKRKHHEAFGTDTDQTNNGIGIAQKSVENRKHPLELKQDMEQPEDNTAAGTPQILDKRSHYEAFGSGDEKEIHNAVEAQQVLEKRDHDQAFGTTKEQERPQEKTPRIIRRISFGDEVDALAASTPKEVVVERSTGKRKHKQAFGMLDDEDEDAEWRDSLAFRPNRMD